MMCSRKRVNHAFIPTDGFLSFNRLNVVGIQKGFFMNKVANPVTPIPPRASAHSSNSVKVRPRYSRTRAIPGDSDVTCIPTMPQPAIWQYESPEYEAASSLSALSLVLSDAEARSAALAIDEIDTLPPPRRGQPLFHAKLSISIDEVETLPPPQRRRHLSPAQKSLSIAHRNVKRQSLPRQTTLTLSGIGELDTLPPGAATVMTPKVDNRRNMLSDLPTAPIIVESNPPGGLEASSWTAGRGKNSALAQRVASRTRGGRSKRRNTPALNPIDRLRWWLLYPGRIEFLLWLSGTLVLVSATCLLLFATALSTGWMSVGLADIPKGTQATAPTNKSTPGQNPCFAAIQGSSADPRCHATTVSSSGLQLTLLDNARLLPGMPIYFHGQGFSNNSPVTFTHDAQIPCQPTTAQADTYGEFTIKIVLDVAFKPGIHQIVAYDTASKRSISVSLTVSPSPMGKSATLTPAPPPPGVTTTVTATGSGQGLPPPGNQPPVSITPTVGATPTPAPTQAPPTPTVGVTPSPTVGATPTAVITPTATTTTTRSESTGSSLLLKNILYDEPVDGHVPLSPWLWIALIGYVLSMTMLGIAGVLYRRNRRAL